MNDQKCKDKIKYIIKNNLQCHVEELPIENAKKTPDLFVRDNEGNEFKIEIKEKYDNKEFRDQQNAQLAETGLASICTAISPDNTISGIAKEASRQLDASRKKAYPILWFHISNSDYMPKREKFISTMFGLETIFTLCDKVAKKCYYFHESAFFTQKESLAAAVISFELNRSFRAGILLNNHFGGYDMLKETEFINKFRGGIIDPITEEENGEAYIADTTIDRNNQSGILKHLENKYKITNPKVMPMNYAGVYVPFLRNFEVS